MSSVAPVGPVYQAGTLSGNPLAVAAGRKMLELLQRDGVYESLEASSARLVDGLAGRRRKSAASRSRRIASARCSPASSPRRRSPTTPPPRSRDAARFGKFFHAMLDAGVFLAPSQFEAAFVSTAHDGRAIDRTVEAARRALASL